MTIPAEILTARLVLRPWRAEDAYELHPILEANYERMSPWIPARIATPGTVPALASRLEGLAADFAAGREWRYAITRREDDRLLGELSLFARSSTGRVLLADADRAEIGYWIRGDAEGRGYVAEAARAVIAAASDVPRFRRIEIFCDERNTASAAIPRRLGFVLSDTRSEHAGAETHRIQVWSSR